MQAPEQVHRLADRLSEIASAYPRYPLLIIIGAGVSAASTTGSDGPNSASTWHGLLHTAVTELTTEYADNLNSSPAGRRLHKQLLGSQLYRETGNLLQTLIEDAQTVVDAFQLIDKASFSIWLDGKMERLKVTNTELLDAIAALGACLKRPPVYATTNYDEMLSGYLGCRSMSIVDPSAADVIDKLLVDTERQSVVLHLHGRHRDRDGSIFSRDQYLSICERNAAVGSLASHLFERTVPLFIGCGAGLRDPDIAALLRRRIDALTQSGMHDHLLDAIAIVDRDVPPGDVYQSFAFGDSHAQLPEFLRQLARLVQNTNNADDVTSYLRVVAEEHSNIRVPPIVIGDHRIHEVPLRGFFGTVYEENVKHIDISVGRGELHREIYEIPGGMASALADTSDDSVVDVDEILAQRFSVILGDPGSGKTTLVRSVIAREATAFFANSGAQARLPILVMVADFSRATKAENSERWRLDEWIYARLGQLGRDPSAGPLEKRNNAKAIFDRFASEGRLLLVFDGLDEASNPEDRQFVVNEVERIATAVDKASYGTGDTQGGGGNRVIVTSRVSGYQSAPITAAHAKYYSVGPMNAEGLRRFFQEFVTGLRQTIAISAEAERLLQGLDAEISERSSLVVQFTRTPLLAAMLMSDFCAHGSLPRDIVSLYERVIDLSCKHAVESGAPGAPGDEGLAPKALLNALALAAFKMFDDHMAGDLIGRDVLDLALRHSVNASAATAAEHTRRMLDILTGEFGLLREKGPEMLGFVHRGLQEYLCGRHLAVLGAHSIAEAAARPGSTQPVIFAAMRTASQGSVELKKLAEEMCKASRLANGARPWLLLLDALGIAPDLAPDAARCVASLHLSLLYEMRNFVDGSSARGPLSDRISRLMSRASFKVSLKEELIAFLSNTQKVADAPVAAAVLIDQQQLDDPDLIPVLRDCLQSVIGPAALRVQRCLRRIATRISQNENATGFPSPPLDLPLHIIRGQGKWLRIVAALVGGYADFEVPHAQWQYMEIARYLSRESDERQAMRRTVPTAFRAVSEEDDIDDFVYSLAVFLDTTGGRAMKMSATPPALDNRFIWRKPLLGEKIADAVKRGLQPESLVGDMGVEAENRERAVVALMLGIGAAASNHSDTVEFLGTVIDDLRDAALRATAALLEVLRNEPTFLAGADNDETRALLLDALASLCYEFRLDFDLSLLSHTLGHRSRNVVLREVLGRLFVGDWNDADFSSGIELLHTVSSSDLLHGLAQLGDGRALKEARPTFDSGVVPPAYGMSNGWKSALADLFDIAENCAPESSTLRTLVLEALSEQTGDTDGVSDEIQSLYALHWGPGAVALPFLFKLSVDGEERSFVEQALRNARKQVDPGSHARSLLRLYRRVSNKLKPQLETEIDQAISLIKEPFEKARALEMLACRSTDAARALRAAREAREVDTIPPMLRARLLAAWQSFFQRQNDMRC